MSRVSRTAFPSALALPPRPTTRPTDGERGGKRVFAGIAAFFRCDLVRTPPARPKAHDNDRGMFEYEAEWPKSARSNAMTRARGGLASRFNFLQENVTADCTLTEMNGCGLRMLSPLPGSRQAGACTRAHKIGRPMHTLADGDIIASLITCRRDRSGGTGDATAPCFSPRSTASQSTSGVRPRYGSAHARERFSTPSNLLSAS